MSLVFKRIKFFFDNNKWEDEISLKEKKYCQKVLKLYKKEGNNYFVNKKKKEKKIILNSNISKQEKEILIKNGNFIEGIHFHYEILKIDCWKRIPLESEISDILDGIHKNTSKAAVTHRGRETMENKLKQMKIWFPGSY